MKRLSGFSLMEMMTVLLILSIVAAATAPMINKKMMKEELGGGAGAGGCLWQDFGNGSITFNKEGKKVSAVIGYFYDNDSYPDAKQRATESGSLLYLSSDSRYSTSPRYPQISMSSNSYAQADLFYLNGTTGFTTTGFTSNSKKPPQDSVMIGRESSSGSNAVAVGCSSVAAANAVTIGQGRAAQYSIAIGEDVNKYVSDKDKNEEEGIVNRYSADAKYSIAIGTNSSTTGAYALSIGNRSLSSNNYSMAIGANALASANQAIAIGSGYGNSVNSQSYSAIASGNDSVAIGSEAITRAANAVAVGSARARGQASIAIGQSARTGEIDGPEADIDENALNAIAIGTWSGASQTGSIAIGARAEATAENSVAIGPDAKATKANQIVLGTADSTVYIPGKLVVGGEAILGLNGGVTWLRAHKQGDNTDKLVKVRYDGDNLEVSGATYSSTDYPLSDRRLKNVGKAFTGGLTELKKLDLFHFTYKKDKSNTPHVGVMAQDLQKVFPDAVTKGDDGFLRIRMEDMFYALVNAVKELAGMFDKQDDRIVQLEKENKQLQKTISDLEKRLEKLEKQK